ncbi:DUF2155 domain-containing protein [Sphingomonas sp. QA11]|nr:DUF2155 domain-containing protein [Sphingomonas sp. QA11]WCM29843.1 DUF2155 domain-containing protein [Sphingomonas sp. QA11]
MRRLLGGAAILTLLAVGGCDRKTDTPGAKPVPKTALDEDQPPSDVVTVDVPSGADPSFGATPMVQRVAVIGLLNKRNGAAREVTLKPGQAVRVGDVIVRLRACEQTAPWEQDHYTGAFVQLDVQQLDRTWKRVFSGWLYKERPALNVVQHPIYDVWTKSCAMTFPVGGPDSVPVGSDEDKPRSSAKKSPAEAAPAVEAPAPTTPSTAADSNPT